VLPQTQHEAILMRLPRVRFTLRSMMVAVALVALSLLPAILAIDLQAHVHDEDWSDDFVPALRLIQTVAACGSLVLFASAVIVICPAPILSIFHSHFLR
jgi:hypothetical protein